MHDMWSRIPFIKTCSMIGWCSQLKECQIWRKIVVIDHQCLFVSFVFCWLIFVLLNFICCLKFSLVFVFCFVLVFQTVPLFNNSKKFVYIFPFPFFFCFFYTIFCHGLKYFTRKGMVSRFYFIRFTFIL